MAHVRVLMPVVKQDRAQKAEAAWSAHGYKMLFYQDPGTTPFGLHPDSKSVIAPYRGVWHATNDLAREALKIGAEACLFAGDDMTPDPKHDANEIAEQYFSRFHDGFGLMQPCGDPQGTDSSGKSAAARICGSPWFGRGWIERSYGGHGPTLGDYYHFYGDEELAVIGEKLGVMWWRPDLTQFHYHWSFGHTQHEAYHGKAQKHWEADQALFFQRKAQNFPGHEPLPSRTVGGRADSVLPDEGGVV